MNNRTGLKTSFVLLIVLLSISAGAAFADYSGGDGTETTPWQIANQADLLYLASHTGHYGAYFIMTADIDLTGTTYTTALIALDTSSSSGFQGTAFAGVFDGNGYKITALTIDDGGAGNDYLGLFGQIGETAEIKNLGIKDVNITSGSDSCGLGGLVGLNYGTITKCYSTGQVQGGDRAYCFGGLVGNNCYGIINKCYSTGQVQGGYSSGSGGGLVGVNYDSKITECYATGSVTGGDGSKYLGGLAGENYYGIINSCYSTGSVDGTDFVGGLVAENYYGIISSCYSTGSVSGDARFGGLVPWNKGMTVYSYWDIQTSGLTESAGGEGKTTIQMKDVDTFSHWAAEPSVWTIDDGNDYPHLAWEQQTGQPINTPLLSDLLDGQGTQSQPYLISDVNELELTGEYPNQQEGAYFELISDINLLSYTYTQSLIPLFSGIFDGAHFTISNLTMDTGPYSAEIGNDYPSLFGQITENGEVKNLGIEDVNIIGGSCSDYLGGLAGKNCGTISNCYSTGSVSGDDNFGGLVGGNQGIISNCYTAATVTGEAGSGYFGGLAGKNCGTISNCYSTGSVSGDDNFGGLVGGNQGIGIISSCYSSCNVQGEEGSWNIGGLVGGNQGIISNCYTTGTVNGGKELAFLGGLVGKNNCGTISNCYSTGEVHAGDSSTEIGGLVGKNECSTVINSYSIGEVQAGDSSTKIGGLVGFNNYSTISRCYSTGPVSGENSTYLGGLLGKNFAGTINNSYSKGPVSGEDFLGGLVGLNDLGQINTCYSTGQVSGNAYLGGLVGENWEGTIDRCCSTGKVQGQDDYLGGLVGENYDGAIYNCYSTGQVSGEYWSEFLGGLVGINYGTISVCFWDTQTSGLSWSDGGTGKTTAEMQTENTFTDVGWDFVGETVNGTEDIWTINEGQDYPKQLWERVNFVGWYGVDFLDYAFFANRWRDTDCAGSNDCDGVDLDFSGIVDIADLRILIDNWLAGVE